MTSNKGTVETTIDRLMPALLRPLWERLLNSHIGYRLVHGAFWSTLGAGLSQSLMLLISVIAARILGREQFGQYGIVIGTVGMFSIVAGFGLGTTATKFVAEYKKTDPAKAGRIIALSSLVAIASGVVATAVLLVIAPWLSARTLAAPQLSGMIRIAASTVLFSAINSSQIGALSGFEAFRDIARINLINGLITFMLVVAGVLAGGLVGALAGQTAAMALSCAITTMVLRKEARRFAVPLGYAGCGAERGVLISFSFPAVLAGLMVSPVTWACSAILVNQLNGYSEMGIFNAANSWQKAILFLPTCIGAIALPMLSQLYSGKERAEYRKALWYNALLNGGAALTAFVMVALFSKIIMGSYGASFRDGYLVLILLCFSSVLVAVASVIGNAIVSAGRMWIAFAFNLVWGVAYIGLASVTVPKYGAVGLALANVLAYTILFLSQLLYVKRLNYEYHPV